MSCLRGELVRGEFGRRAEIQERPVKSEEVRPERVKLSWRGQRLHLKISEEVFLNTQKIKLSEQGSPVFAESQVLGCLDKPPIFRRIQ
eukprot:COSAG02_NODE_725_length_18021_cov_392.218279_6_plen_88_part_00